MIKNLKKEGSLFHSRLKSFDSMPNPVAVFKFSSCLSPKLWGCCSYEDGGNIHAEEAHNALWKRFQKFAPKF